jgi:hypothetical protein
MVRDKSEALRREARRHPQAGDLLAAVFGDRILYDYLQHKMRHDVVSVDEFGNESTSTVSDRILELEEVAALYVLLAKIVQNGGHEITVGEHGALGGGDGLPLVPPKTLGQLRRNGFITARREAAGLQVGTGERVREIAARWSIQLPGAAEEAVGSA